jgi:hypothetical protein
LEKEISGVYIQMPRGFGEDGKVLKLKKSLYGLKQSPRNFFLHLKAKLEKVGFTQSENDPCLFMNDKVICTIYVDDTLFYYPNEIYIQEAIEALRKEDMDLEVESDVAGFLGVLVTKKPDGTIHLTQTGLIQRILAALNMADFNTKETPAEHGCLPIDKDGDPPQGTYSYPSVIGMLGYFGPTRPDTGFATSQCARFTHNTRRSHEKALERSGQYLKITQDKGLILRPAICEESGELPIDCYVDVDFAGLWGYEDRNDASCVKSRAGYVINIANCPVIWKSKLQSCIASSTMEAEYNALSMAMAMRDVLPLRNLTIEISKGVGMSGNAPTTFKTTVWEDNNGALKLGTMEPVRTTPRSKAFGVR